MAHKILVVNLHEVFANYADKDHKFLAHLLRDHLASLHETGQWPEDGIDFDKLKYKVYEEKLGLLNSKNHKAFMLIGSIKSFLAADWVNKDAKQFLCNCLFNVTAPTDQVDPGYMVFYTSSADFDGVLNSQES